jgi:NADPH:quinone reductase-like Zn-dependent oxidoreductase
MASETPTAVVQRGNDLVIEEIELPALKEHQVCVKVECAAFNPTDSSFCQISIVHSTKFL